MNLFSILPIFTGVSLLFFMPMGMDNRNNSFLVTGFFGLDRLNHVTGQTVALVDHF